MNLIFKTLSNDKKISYIAVALSGVAAAKIITLATLILADNPTPSLKQNSESATIFENYKLSTKFALANKITANATTQNWKLKAVFRYAQGSFVIFEDGSKTVFLGIGESYNGYKLEEISQDKAKFSNGGASFEIKIDKKTSDNIEKVSAEPATENFNISRSKYEKYAKNAGLLMDEVKASQTNDGVVINSVAKDSFFSELGLKDGDTVAELNGSKVSSFSDLLAIFKEPEKTKKINIIIKRQNLRKELNYEIN